MSSYDEEEEGEEELDLRRAPVSVDIVSYINSLDDVPLDIKRQFWGFFSKIVGLGKLSERQALAQAFRFMATKNALKVITPYAIYHSQYANKTPMHRRLLAEHNALNLVLVNARRAVTTERRLNERLLDSIQVTEIRKGEEERQQRRKFLGIF